MLCDLGLDGLRFLYTADPIDRVLLAALVARMRRLRRTDHEALATLIINRLGEAMR